MRDSSPSDGGGEPGRKEAQSSHHPRTLDELTEKNIATIARLDDVATANRSSADRTADLIAGFCGTMWFVWVHVAWFGLWVTLNLWPFTRHFDAFPFTFLTLVVSLEAIFLSAFILISQNHSSRQSERRNHLDLQINLLSEQENTKMLALLKAIAEKMGATSDQNPPNEVLDQATNPEKLVEQIDLAIRRGT